MNGMALVTQFGEYEEMVKALAGFVKKSNIGYSLFYSRTNFRMYL